MSSARSHLIKSIIPPAKRRPMVGYVSSARLMSKTVKVRIPRVVVVPKYRKRVVRHTVLLVHDPEEQCDVGDKVAIRQSRPYSKKKHHIIHEILVKDPGAAFLAENPEYDLSRVELKEKRLAAQRAEQQYKDDTAARIAAEQTKQQHEEMAVQQKRVEQMQELAARHAAHELHQDDDDDNNAAAASAAAADPIIDVDPVTDDNNTDLNENNDDDTTTTTQK